MNNMVNRHFHRVGVMRAIIAVGAVFASNSFPFVLHRAYSEGPAKQPASRVKREPEEVLLDFIIAMLAGETDRIERLTVQHPDVIVLSQGERMADDAVSALRTGLPKSFSRLKIGDKVEVPGGGTGVGTHSSH